MYPYNARYESIVRYNPATDEPFIPLPAPHSNIRLTPPRMDAVEDILVAMNHPSVYMNFTSPPYPYLQDHCLEWLQGRMAEYEQAIEHISETDEEVGFLDIFPFRHIREIGPDETETFLGDIGMTREADFDQIENAETRAAKAESNCQLAPGDPDIVWSISDWISPVHQGRGIMSAAIKTMIESWAIPHMNARKFYVSTFANNIASQKTFLKNGFKYAGRVDGVVKFPESKGGLLMDAHYYELDIPADKAA